MTNNEVILAALNERFKSLPEALQNAITSSDYQQKLINIQQKYKLTIEQLGILEQETSFVLLGLTLSRDYSNSLKEQLKIDDNTLNSIVSDINTEIFIKIKDILIDIEGEADEEMKKKQMSDQQDGIWADEMSAQIAKERGETNVKEESIIKDESREELLSHIENPPATSGLNLSALKISKPVVGPISKPNVVNTPNLSTPGNNPPVQSAPTHTDAYREKPE